MIEDSLCTERALGPKLLGPHLGLKVSVSTGGIHMERNLKPRSNGRCGVKLRLTSCHGEASPNHFFSSSVSACKGFIDEKLVVSLG